MPKQSMGIMVPKIHGEKTIILTNKLQILDRELEIQKNEGYIYLPLVRRPSENELKKLKEQVPSIQVSSYTFPERVRRPANYAELLEGTLPPHLLAVLPHSADFVGDIAIIEIAPELEPHKAVVGEAILKANKRVKTVLAKAGAVSGTYRLREFNVVAGEPKTVTIHKENGCQYYVDVAKAYFSPRLSCEHSRVASLVKDSETVVDLFAGVGPFAVLIAKTHEGVKVYAVDVNPDAVEFLKRNVRLNRVENKVIPILGNARQVVEDRLSGIADRVIMNLPEKAMDFIDTACNALKPLGGTIHFYSFISASESLENTQLRFTKTIEKCGRKVDSVLFSRLVRATAPHEWQTVLDANIH
jgi:tRNA (guanine37-N1)-methyltransferase